MAGSQHLGKPGEVSAQESLSAGANLQEKPAGRAILRIGTRGSPLALIQAEEVKARLIAANPDLADPAAIEIVVIKTTGDKVQDRTLSEIGGKGLFTKEIEEGLLDRSIDLAVHSMKDMPTFLPEGLDIACLLPREDPRDVLISAGGATLDKLPQGTVVGTASLRRQAQLKALRPDLTIVPLRGNVGTRLAKIERGDAAATLLALAGLKRLGQADLASEVLSVDQMLPAAAQGVIGVECRSDDKEVLARLAAIHRAAASGADVALISRGGYGLTRILPGIRYKAVAKAIDKGMHFVGVSDFTAFQLAVLAKTGATTWAGPALNKTPLVYWQRHFAFLKSSHQLWPPRLNQPARGLTGALLHFKFLADIKDKLGAETVRRQHTAEYAAYTEALDSRRDEDPEFVGVPTAYYEGWPSLLRDGLISSDAAFA